MVSYYYLRPKIDASLQILTQIKEYVKWRIYPCNSVAQMARWFFF
jgi:hypothetical protein